MKKAFAFLRTATQRHAQHIDLSNYVSLVKAETYIIAQMLVGDTAQIYSDSGVQFINKKAENDTITRILAIYILFMVFSFCSFPLLIFFFSVYLTILSIVLP